ncbi:cyd operon YbgE family protein [Pseudomonas helleri]|uniref:cyd operon YbgE family protein n=1 Tax=Pseudomonas helleri TaxID=1608996 RepID=UPI003FCF5F58
MPEHRSWTQHGACRAVSLVLEAPMGLLLLIHPGAMVSSDGRYSHGLLMLVMCGVCAGFIHGVGFLPAARSLRWATYLPLTWSLLVMGYVMLINIQFNAA